MTEAEIHQQLEAMLSNCDKVALPSICKKVSRPGGLEFVKNMLIKMVTDDGLSIDEAMGHIESELNEIG